MPYNKGNTLVVIKMMSRQHSFNVKVSFLELNFAKTVDLTDNFQEQKLVAEFLQQYNRFCLIKIGVLL